MNTPRLPDDVLAVWLDENNVPLPPATRRAIEVGIGTVRQRRRPIWLPSRRFADMNTYAKLAIAAAAVLVVAVVGYNLLPTSGGLGGQVATPSPSPSASPSLSAPPTPPVAAVTGPLEAGTYRITQPWHTLRPFAFTVPDGWRREENFVNKGDVWEGNGVTMATWVVSHIYRDSCQWEGTLRQTTSVVEVVQALTEQTGHESTGPSATTFAGYPATRLELSLPADADLSGCDGQFARLWPDAGPLEQYGLPISPGQTTTVYVVDLDGRPTLIVAISKETSTATDVAELEQVIESIRFQ